MKVDKEFRALGIKKGVERVADVTRIITQLKGESTVMSWEMKKTLVVASNLK